MLMTFVDKNGTPEKVEVSDETLELMYQNAINIVKNANSAEECVEGIKAVTSDIRQQVLISEAVLFILRNRYAQTQALNTLLNILVR